MRRRRRLRLVLAIWLAAYPIASCIPVVLGTAAGGVDLGVAGLLVAATLLIPWLVGILVIGILFLLVG